MNMAKILKNAGIFVLCMAMCLAIALPTFAAEKSVNGPDLVITDIRINNPYFTGKCFDASGFYLTQMAHFYVEVHK